MATLTMPPVGEQITATDRLEQQMVNLRKANASRLAGAAAKRKIKAGRLTVVQALDDPDAGVLTMLDLLMAQPRWGRHRALKLLSRGYRTTAYIPEGRRVRDLTEHQRTVLRTVLR